MDEEFLKQRAAKDNAEIKKLADAHFKDRFLQEFGKVIELRCSKNLNSKPCKATC